MDGAKPVLVVTTGLPASGKSVLSLKLAEEYNATVFSSDALRKELFGDENNQDNNSKLFNELHKRIKECLTSGNNVIYDATNISSKRRRAFLQELNKIDCHKKCVIVATPYEQCQENNHKRDKKVPRHVIEKMYRHWNTPHYFEGWDEIEIQYWKDIEFKLSYEWVLNHWKYKQNNQHHTLSLGEHCYKTAMKCNNYYVFNAGLIHDCGKPFTKQFKDSKGKRTKYAHYYGHENVGAYDALFFCNITNEDTLLISTLVNLHIKPYEWERDNNEKLHNKYKKLWGEELYNMVMELHEADKEAH